jgi:hypothetical protein
MFVILTDTVRYSETSTPIYHATGCHNPEFHDMNLHDHKGIIC